MDDQLSAVLTQLRDIHEPTGWLSWPMPVGWWLLLLLFLTTVACVCWWWYNRLVTDQPYRFLREAAETLQSEFSTANIKETEYVNAANRLFKHLLIELENTPHAKRASGQEWLNMLALRFNDSRFTSGEGNCLGTLRFQPIDYFNPSLIELVEDSLCKVKEPTRRNTKYV